MRLEVKAKQRRRRCADVDSLTLAATRQVQLGKASPGDFLGTGYSRGAGLLAIAGHVISRATLLSRNLG
jgi:poly(3-hydroxybutyrate) depolymerase